MPPSKALQQSWFKQKWLAVTAILASVALSFWGRANAVQDQALTNSINQAIDKKLDDNQLSQMRADVSALKAQMDQVNRNMDRLLDHDLKQTASLPSEQFNQNTQRINRLLSVAIDMHSAIRPITVEGVRAKLVTSQNRNDAYWSAVSTLAAYRSPAQTRQLPSCRSRVVEAVTTVAMSRDEQSFNSGILAPLLRDCRLDLSAGLPNVTTDSNLAFVEGTLHCLRCQLYYSGVSRRLLDDSLANLKLDQCSFDIHITASTPKEGRNFALAILNSPDQAKVVVGSPS